MKKELQIEFHKLLKKELKQRKNLSKKYNWDKNARNEQKIPKNPWDIWLILAGRGFGKTRTGAESIRYLVEKKGYKNIAIIGKSINEARSIMVEGESGIIAVSPMDEKPTFYSSKRLLKWPNGAIATLFGGDDPEQLRGPQFDLAWVDELCKFRKAQECLDQLTFSLRLGKQPKAIISTTPKPIPALKQLMNRNGVHLTKGTTFDNKENLAEGFLTHLTKHLSNTRLGSQELYGHVLEETQGALWTPSMIKYEMPPKVNNKFDLARIIIAIDPATTHHEKSDETGIVVCGITQDNKAYILEDLSGRHSPSHWGQIVVDAYWKYSADRVVAETNKGGDLVERVLRVRDPNVSYKEVHATRGKAVRAEPVAALYEKGFIYHSEPHIKLEEQLCGYIPGITKKSPDRLDALVWGLTDLMLEKEASPFAKIW
jgi:phage terminase large subunit-like protein